MTGFVHGAAGHFGPHRDKNRGKSVQKGNHNGTKMTVFLGKKDP
jgi:hypothetical protein